MIPTDEDVAEDIGDVQERTDLANWLWARADELDRNIESLGVFALDDVVDRWRHESTQLRRAAELLLE